MIKVFICILVICQENCLDRILITDFRHIELKLINITFTPSISVYYMG